MSRQLDVLDEHHFPLLNLMAVTQQQFETSIRVKPDLARLSELTDVLLTLWKTQAAVVGLEDEQRPPQGHYAVKFSPDLQKRLDEGSAVLQNSQGQLKAQVRDRDTGRILGVGNIIELLPPQAPGAATLMPAPAAVGVALAVTAFLSLVESMEDMHNKLDEIRGGIEAIHTRLDINDNAVLMTAFSVVKSIRVELRGERVGQEDRRDMKIRLEHQWVDVQRILYQDRQHIENVTQAKVKGGKRLPLPQRRQAPQAEDASLRHFARFIFGLMTQMHLLAALELTEVGRALHQKEQDIKQDLQWVRQQHRAYRALWAKDVDSVQRYGINVNGHFELIDQMDALTRQLETLERRPTGSQTLLLEVNATGHVSRVALPAVN